MHKSTDCCMLSSGTCDRVHMVSMRRGCKVPGMPN